MPHSGWMRTAPQAQFRGATIPPTTSTHSWSGMVVFGGGAVSCMSQRQTSAVTSTTEAEIVAAIEAPKEVLWLKRLFKEITGMDSILLIFIDNATAAKLTRNPKFHRRTKHIALRHFFIRRRVVE